MNLIVRCVIFLSIGICWSIRVAAVVPDKALILSKKTYQLEEISRVDPKKKCYSCLTACPAVSERRRNFNKKISIGRNSIYLQKIYKDEELAKNIDLEICHKPFKPSILFHEKTNSYQIGYELYYEEEKCTLKALNNWCYYEDFEPAVITDSTKKHGQSTTFPKLKPRNIGDKNARFKYSRKEILSFFWIPVLSFNFNPAQFQIRIDFHGDVMNNYKTISKCENYDLGYQLFASNKDVNLFHSKKNQKEMFNKIDFASGQPSTSCTLADKCLERTHLMPMMYFNTRAAKLATCTFLNTVPMWSSIVEGQLKVVDRYLYTIFRLWPQNIQIVFGAADVLTLNNEQISATTLQAPSSDNNQNAENQIRIPKIIYRIIEYHLSLKLQNNENENDQDQKNEENENHNYDNDEDWIFCVVIIIHNDPEASDKDRLCPLQRSLLFEDWKAIYNDDAKKGLSYPCTLSDRMIEILGADNKIPGDDYRVLYLSNLTHFDKNKSTSKFRYVDERNAIDNEMKKLFP